MSIPHYTKYKKWCHWCESEIHIGHDAMYRDGYYCNEDCLKVELLADTTFEDVYLTDDKIYRDVD